MSKYFNILNLLAQPISYNILWYYYHLVIITSVIFFVQYHFYFLVILKFSFCNQLLNILFLLLLNSQSKIKNYFIYIETFEKFKVLSLIEENLFSKKRNFDFVPKIRNKTLKLFKSRKIRFKIILKYLYLKYLYKKACIYCTWF